ncbi:MAG TPA: ComEC/Rec2 family competence protein, partial [Planctomycetaceae bacterium]
MSSDSSEPKHEPAGRSPCLPVAAALAAGIAIDHAVALPRVPVLVAAAVLLAVLSSAREARRPFRVAALLLLFGALGAVAHGTAWRDRSPDSVARLPGERPKLVRLTGTLIAPPVVERRRESGRKAAWQLDDRTRVVVEAEGVSDESGSSRRVTGRVQLTSAGHLIHVAAGDRIEVTGWLRRPADPRNPGGFDARDHLRKRRIDAALYVDHPDAVRRIGSPGFDPRRAVAGLRERLSVAFAEHLSVRNGPVGAAMILGDRSTMPLDVRDAYVASGAMHILAISGLNVGILAAPLVVLGRLLNLSSVGTALAAVAGTWAYAVLTDLEPPVVRATLFLTLWALATLVMRRPSPLNTAAATALVLLLWDPLLLFDLGAQLSFLAVLGMSWSLRAVPSANRLFEELAEDRPWRARIARSVLVAQAMGLGVWLFTAPLIAAEFGIVSPVGFLLNVILIPLAAVVMWAGYAFFGVCLLLPQAAGPFGAFFDFGLSAVNALVVGAGEWRLGHVFTPPPPGWWLVGFYALLFVGLIRPAWAGRRLRGWSVLLGWTCLGLTFGLAPTDTTGGCLRMTALDAGHGAAILVEAPNGRTLLFDCGSMEDDRRTAEAVWRAMRLRGGTRLDAVLISHADLDHCNNLPALLRGGPVGTVVASRSFLDFDQTAVTAVCDAAREAGVPIRLIKAGDAIRLDPETEITVLHPPDRSPHGDDNANSVVLRIGYAGRTILLTGDLEGPGQTELFARHPDGGCDVLVSPHHG